MTDGPRKSMTRDPADSAERRSAFYRWRYEDGPTTKCDKCGRLLCAGDWPFCGGLDPRDHDR